VKDAGCCQRHSGLWYPYRRQPDRRGGKLPYRGALPDELVERQVHQVVGIVAVDQHLAGLAEHRFHGFHVQALAGDLGRLPVFGQQLRKAARFTLGLGHQRFLVAVGFLDLAGGGTARPGNDVIGVGFGLVFQPFLVLARLDGIGERRLHFLRRLRVLQIDVRHQQAGRVGGQGLLHQLLDIGHHLRTAFLEYEVHFALADDFAYHAFGHLLEHGIGITHVEQVALRVAHLVLHRQLDVDDVLVLGQHQRLARHRHHALSGGAGAVADFDETALFDVDDFNLLDRIGYVPVRPRRCGFRIGAESQHHTLLAGVDDIDARKHPDQGDNAGNHPETREARAATTAAAAVTALAATPEQPAELVLHLLDNFVEIRRALVSATAPRILVTASRLVPGHV